ncbi:MAG: hypothetical protein JSS25_00120 [Proteobacteria bacterium]|nr:hypothetical protein [Pseudomonadota bacterium]
MRTRHSIEGCLSALFALSVEFDFAVVLDFYSSLHARILTKRYAALSMDCHNHPKIHMSTSQKLHSQIERATKRLAQSQARELLTAQRNANRKKAAEKRRLFEQRKRIGDAVIAAGCGDLPESEIVGALLLYLGDSPDDAARENLRAIGKAHLAAAAGQRKH